MVRTRVLSRVGAAVSLVGMLAAGCSNADGQPAPTAEPSVTDESSEAPSSSEPTSPAPGPTPWPEPTRPAAMERDDIQGAKAAAEYFLALYPYIFATGDLEEWEVMSAPECQFCANAKGSVVKLFEGGGYGVGGDIAVQDVSALPPDDQWEHFRVGVKGVEGRSVEYSPAGEVLREFDGGELTYNFALVPSGAGWLVRGVSLEEG